jgi:hypothetical protein
VVTLLAYFNKQRAFSIVLIGSGLTRILVKKLGFFTNMRSGQL